MSTIPNHAKHAFFYVLILVTLGFVAIGAGQVLFSIIEHFLPDITASYNNYSDDILRFGLSALLVASPIYYFLTRQINNDLAKKELSADSGIRRWLTYFIILIAAVTGIGDLIASFNSYLSGELTLRFALKAGVILMIAAAVLSYYIFDLTRKDFLRGPLLKSYNAGFILAVLATFITGISIATSPSVLREQQIDNQRISDLQAIESAVNQYYTEQKKLPADLAALTRDTKVFEKQTKDPVTSESYGYKVTSKDGFELCATFAQAIKNQKDGFYFEAKWQHDAGKVCFARVLESWALEQAKQR